MKILKFHIVGILISLNIFSYSQESINEFSKLFDPITFDTLHLYPSNYYSVNLQGNANTINIEGEKIPHQMVQQLKLDSICGSNDLKAINRFNFGPQGLIGFVIGIQEDSPYDCSVGIMVYSMMTKSVLFYLTAASYKHMEFTMESTKNTWIYDSNQDGYLDIIYMIDLIDYELPNEYADNISGVKSGELRYNPDSKDFDSYYLGSIAYKVLSVKK